jgi:capsid protein
MASKPVRFFDSFGRLMPTRISQAAIGSQQRRARTGFDRDSANLYSGTDRLLLMSMGRWLYANNSLVAGAVDDQAAIVSGELTPQFAGEDAAWGALAEQWLEDHDRLCDVRGDLYPMQTLQRLWMLHIIRDGDVGVIFTEGAGGYPLLQTIPAHRIKGDGVVGPESPWSGRRLVDGVIVNEVGRPLAYRVYDDAKATYQDISAVDMKVRFLPRYVDQVRGFSALGCAMVDFQDIDEVRRFELVAQKLAASIVLAETNETGLPPGDAESLLGQDSTETNPDANIAMHTMQGGEIRYFRSGTGGKLEALMADRPTPAQQSFADSIIRQAMVGMGWSIDYFLDPSKVGGASMRVVVERINRHVGMMRSQCLFPLARSVDAWRIAKAMKEGMLPPSDDWFRWRYQGAANITADAKYSADVSAMRVELGLSSPQDESASIGKDWEQVQDQQIAYAIRFREKCAAAGISTAEVKAIAANAKPSAPPPQAQPPQPPQDQTA